MAPRLLFAVALLLAGGTACAGPDEGERHAVVLAYHHVGENTPPSTSVTPATFEAHLEYLADNGFHVWPLSRILDRLSRGKSVPESTVALTFDDAYESVLTQAYPRLKRRDWPFTVFVSTDYIDRDFSGYMDWGQLRELARDGAEIGNHSLGHPHLVRRRKGEAESQWLERVRQEITGAQRRLQEELPNPVKVFAYPFGEYDRPVRSLVEELGYFGVGQQSGAVGPDTDLTAVPRFPMATGFADLDSFATKVRSRPLPVTVLAPEDRLLGGDEKERPVLRIRVGEGPFRSEALGCFASGQGRMEVTWADREEGVAEVRPREPLPPGRTKYNCTAPSTRTSGVFHWFSYLWLKRNPDGSWYRE